PMGYVISFIRVAFSVFSLWASFLFMRGKDYATVQQGGGGLSRRDLKPREKVLAWAVMLRMLAPVRSPHVGLLLLAFGTIWSFSPLPDDFTIQHFGTIFTQSSQYIWNTLAYAGTAAVLDVVLGTAIAYIVIRTKLAGRKWLDYMATAA